MVFRLHSKRGDNKQLSELGHSEKSMFPTIMNPYITLSKSMQLKKS